MTEWMPKQLSDVVELRRGFDLPTKSRRPGPYRVLSAGVTAGWHDEAPVAGPGFVIGRATNLGVPTWSDEDFWPLNTTLYAADFKGNHPKFLFHLFETLDLSGFDSGSVQPMLNRNYIAGLEVRVPNFSTQVAIAEVLGALDDKIAANSRIQDLVRDLLSMLFSQFEAADGVAETILLDEMITFNPTERLSASPDDPVYLEMKNLPDRAMTVSDWGHRAARGGARFRNGDALLARITPCLENGKAGYVDFLDDGEIGVGSTEFIVMRPKPNVPAAFAYFLSVSPRFREYAIRHMVGTTGRQRLSAADVAAYEIGKPDSAMLAEFDEVSQALLSRVKAAVDETRVLAKTRDELLPLLMSGKLRVKDAEQIVEKIA
ncbi:restriction endonuclease subunit S [Nocardia sp. NPDC004415]